MLGLHSNPLLVPRRSSIPIKFYQSYQFIRGVLKTDFLDFNLSRPLLRQSVRIRIHLFYISSGLQLIYYLLTETAKCCSTLVVALVGWSWYLFVPEMVSTLFGSTSIFPMWPLLLFAEVDTAVILLPLGILVPAVMSFLNAGATTSREVLAIIFMQYSLGKES